MFPYHDENETQRRPIVTWGFLGLNVFAWLAIQGAGTDPALAASVCRFGLIAGQLTGSLPPGTRIPLGEDVACVIGADRNVAHIVTSMFMHGSWLHLLGNMWFLYLFGNNVEDSMGRGRFIVFYLVSGVAAALTQVALYPTAAVPMVGASGAISGVMGGYLVLYPRVRVYTLVPLGFFLWPIALPAWTMLLYWFALQLLGGVTMVAGATGGGIAFWAHVGGFVAGLVLVKFFARPEYVAAHRAHHFRPRRWNRAA